MKRTLAFLLSVAWAMTTLVADLSSPAFHPLDGLTAAELNATVEVLKADPRFPRGVLIVYSALREPPKKEVLAWRAGQPFRRESFTLLLDLPGNQTIEVIVDVRQRQVASWKPVPGAQALYTEHEYEKSAAVIRQHPDWQAAMQRRGITDFNRVGVAAIPPGIGSVIGPKEGRMRRTFCWLKEGKPDGIGHPIEGVDVIFDANRMEVVRVIDSGVRPMPTARINFYDPTVRGKERARLKTLRTIAPEGPGFTLRGSEVAWDNWRIRFGFHPRDGLMLHTVAWQDRERLRPVLYRASVSEMLVPYGDPDELLQWWRFLDAGESGLGKLATPLEPGRTTAAHATLLDVPFVKESGEISTKTNVIELYEREGGGLWSHFDSVAGHEGRRSRELLLGFLATIGNYDYRYTWIFRTDGSIEFETELNGIVLTKAVHATACQACRRLGAKSHREKSEPDDRYGTLVAPHVVAVNHQHFINVRLDLDVDGPGNSVKEINAEAVKRGRSNPYGNAFVATQTFFASERAAGRDVNPASHRSWIVFNPSVATRLGHYPGYALEPGANTVPYLAADTLTRKVAGFLEHHFFATRQRDTEIYAAGDYPSQATKADNVQTWTRDNEPLLHEDLILWYTFGVTHVPRPEDYPVMPTARAGFRLVPKAFFDRNPALDVPDTPTVAAPSSARR